MSGLQKILKRYGAMRIDNVLWVWDYAKDQPRIKSEMTKAEREASRIAEFQVPAQ